MKYRRIQMRAEGYARSQLLFFPEIEEIRKALPLPKNFCNPRGRFWFTSLGWNLFGKKMLNLLKKRGIKLKIKVKKTKIQPIWHDKYQAVF